MCNVPVDGHADGAIDRDELTVATFNIWFDPSHAQERYTAIADLLSRDAPDVMVFQEVTPAALTLFLANRGFASIICARLSSATAPATTAC